MSEKKSLGELELLILAALSRMDNNAYGVAIVNEIENRSGRRVSLGALYPTLARLQKKRYVRSKMGEATPVRGGRAKRYYRLTVSGSAALERSSSILSSMLAGLPGWVQGAK